MGDSPATRLAAVLAFMARKPLPMSRAIEAWETANDEEFSVSQLEIAQSLREDGAAGPLRGVLRERLAHWDHLATEEAGWAEGAEPNTDARRQRIYDLLDLAPELQGAVVDLLPPHLTDERNVVISREGWAHWYTDVRRVESQFYWSHYARYLRDLRDWDPDNVEALDEATTAIVERLADPRQAENRATRGLVVGHVQSGKTANLTGVIAKAADAGYRLVIVLSGMTDLLRNQTQRRLDKELIGKDLIRPANADPTDEELDYQGDADWEMFIDHGGKPSELGSFDWIRLTGEEWDYRRLKAGIETLEFSRVDSARPFYAAENLRPAAAKVMVVKKQSQRLSNVLRDLRRITTRLADVPALVIDDESDQASINTATGRDENDRRRRTKINGQIVELLETLPRAQYVGYTATPFASVLIDPDDEEDLFPRDFVVSLRAPRNYMGARDFHDIDGEPVGVEDDPIVSNQRAFVRDVKGPDDNEQNLPRAIDSFVLAGALKLYRAERAVEVSTKHHTMLIHSSRLQADHEADRQRADALFDSAGFETAAGAKRLEQLLCEDFAPVSANRAVDLPFPKSWSEISPYVGAAIAKIRGAEGPVLVVNGTDQSADPDFDRQGVWKILVGGAKLSRGYTVEGLTTTYFRRRATTGDVLMQMGRWFGYRENYLDLVRLFISREEQAGRRGRKYDLYEAFEAVCRDEEAFRSQLQRYALSENKEQEPITPLKVPPLVYSHLSWLPPVADNKRSGTVAWENWGGRWNEPTLAPSDRGRMSMNASLFRDVLGGCDLRSTTFSLDGRSFDAATAEMPPAAVRELLTGYQWFGSAAPVTKVVEFMDGTGDRDPEIDRWILLAPRLKQKPRVPDWKVGDMLFTVKYRARISTEGSRVKAYSEPLHRDAAERIALLPGKDGSGLPDEFSAPGTAVMLFYPTHHVPVGDEPLGDLIPTMGFALLFPENKNPQQVVFVARPDE
jgi:Z1 domain